MDQEEMPHLLFKAIFDGNASKVKRLLLAGCSPDINLQDSDRLTPLVFATVRGQQLIVQLLITFKADLNLKAKLEMTALMHACVRNHDGILSLLLSAGSDVNLVDRNGKNAFLHAAQSGSVDCVHRLLQHGSVNLNVQDDEGNTAVTLAARRDDSRCLNVLLKLGADANVADDLGNCPLASAIHLCKIPNALVLLDNNVMVNVINKEGKSPLTKAFDQIRNQSMMQVLNKLFHHGAAPHLSSSDENYLHDMIARGKTDIVQRMILNGCAPRLRQCNENIFKFHISDALSPFAVALLSNKLGVAKYILANSFLTKYDIHQLPKSHVVINHLSSHGFSHCRTLLADMSSNPLPLVTLSLITLCSVYYDCSNTVKNYLKLHLPHELFQKLLYRTECASICTHEWETIPLMLSGKQDFPKPRHFSVLWPIGQRLEKCSFVSCREKRGYRFVRNIDIESHLRQLRI